MRKPAVGDEPAGRGVAGGPLRRRLPGGGEQGDREVEARALLPGAGRRLVDGDPSSGRFELGARDRALDALLRLLARVCVGSVAILCRFEERGYDLEPLGEGRRLEGRLIVEAPSNSSGLDAELVRRGIELVAVSFVDNAGITRAKCMPAHRLERAAEVGIGSPRVLGVFQGDDRIAPAGELSRPVGDLRLVPDLQALAGGVDGWGWAPGDQLDQEGCFYECQAA